MRLINPPCPQRQLANCRLDSRIEANVIVFTTRPSGSTADVLRSYRMRWQIELVFKRLKGLAQLGHVPKHDDRISRAWLYGKLLVTLLAQKLIRIGRDIFPLGLTILSAGLPCSPSHFSFVLHQMQQAIEPQLSLQQTLYSWNKIAAALAEKSRNRLLQWRNGMLGKHHFKSDRSKRAP